jgi:outer membrane murein-binding lipoprotein Lpp
MSTPATFTGQNSKHDCVFFWCKVVAFILCTALFITFALTSGLYHRPPSAELADIVTNKRIDLLSYRVNDVSAKVDNLSTRLGALERKEQR